MRYKNWSMSILLIFAITCCLFNAEIVMAYNNLDTNSLDSFLKSPYVYDSYSFEELTNERLSGNVNIVRGQCGNLGNSLSLNGDTVYTVSPSGQVGRTEIAFQFAAEELSSSASFTIYGKDCGGSNISAILTIKLLPDSDNSAIGIYIVNESSQNIKLGKVLTGTWVTANIQIDTTESTYHIAMNTIMESIIDFEGNLTTGALVNYSFLKMVFNSAGSTDKVFVDNFFIKRNGAFYTNNPVIAKCGNSYIAGARIMNNSETEKEYTLYINRYNNDNNVIKMEDAVSNSIIVKAGQETYIEAYLYNSDYANIKMLKSFLWEKEIYPSGNVYLRESSSVEISEIELNAEIQAGCASAEYTVGEIITFNGSSTLPPSVTEIHAVVSNADGEITNNITADINSYSSDGLKWTPEASGDFHIVFYASYQGIYLIQFAELNMFITPAISSAETFIMHANKPFYYRNGEKCFYSNKNGNYIPTSISGKVLIPAETLRNLIGAQFVLDESANTLTINFKMNNLVINLSNNSVLLNGSGSKEIVPTLCSNNNVFVSFNDVMNLFGFNVYFDGDALSLISLDSFWSTLTDSGALDSLYKHTVFNDGFENISKNSSGVLSAPEWQNYDWGSPSVARNDFGIASDEKSKGGYSGYLSAIASSFMGFESNKLDFDKKNFAYKFTLNVKCSSDYKGNRGRLLLLFYEDNVFTASQFYDLNTISSTGWSENTLLLEQSMYPAGNVNKIIIAPITAFNEGYSNQPAGKIYFDDIRCDVYKSITSEKFGLIQEYKNLFGDYLLNNDFENVIIRNGKITSSDWGFYDWGTAGRPATGYGISNEIKSRGAYSAYVSAAPSSFAGFTSSFIEFNNLTSAYKLTFKVRASQDYQFNKPKISLFFYKDSTYINSITNTENIIVTSDGWTLNSVVFKNSSFKKFDANRMYILIGTAANVSGSYVPAGNLYFDEVKCEKYYPSTDTIKTIITADKEGAWYILGDEVVFKCSGGDFSSVEKVNGAVYNADGEIVYENSVSSFRASTYGWRWKPEEPGYYEVEFSGTRLDGSQIPIVSFYQAASGNNSENFELQRRSFAVAPCQTKPMAQRNEKLYLSDNAKNADNLALADLVGFYGIRLHYLPWGTTYGEKGINTARGVYDWSVVDGRLSNIDKYGFGGIIANVLGTPQWAAPSDAPSGTTMVGLYKANCVAPADITYWEEFMAAMTNRYKDRINQWEIWNEEQMGNTAFWCDTPQNYGKILKAAYSTIKQIQPDSTVAIGGMHETESYYQFYDQLLEDPDIYNSFDVLAMHGTSNSVPVELQKIAVGKGYSQKPWMNTEGYFYCVEDYDTPAWLSYDFVLRNLLHFKYNSQITTDFEITDNTSAEELAFRKSIGSASGHCMGLFRSYPVVEPKLGAVVAHNLFELIGKDFIYQSEYKLSDGQRAVLFENDGEPALILWNSQNEEFNIDQSIINCFADDIKITDWEGKTVSNAQSVLKANKMYYITGLDMTKLGKLEASDDGALNVDFISPQYTCKTESGSSEQVYIPAMYNASGKLFNYETFEQDENVEWIKDDWNWAGGSKPAEFAASHAAYIGDDGLYLMLNVTDSTQTYGSNDLETMNNYDSIQFAVDCSGNGYANKRVEFQALLSENGPVIYKKTAPYIGSNLPNDWSGSGTQLSGNYINIIRSENETLYKVFIPMSEMYPYVFPGLKDFIRLSLVVNNNNGSGEIGHLEWGGGLADDEAKPYKYGKLIIECITESEIIGDKARIYGKTIANIPLCLMVKHNDGIYYLNQGESAADGSFEFYVPLSDYGEYSVYISGIGLAKNYVTKFERPLKVSIENKTAVFQGVTETNTPICLLTKYNNNVYYLNQVLSDCNGYYEFRIPLSDYGVYTVSFSGLSYDRTYTGKFEYSS